MGDYKEVGPDVVTSLDSSEEQMLKDNGMEGQQLLQDFKVFYKRFANRYSYNKRMVIWDNTVTGFFFFWVALVFNLILALLWGVAAQTEDGVYETVDGVEYDSWTTAFGSFYYLNLIHLGGNGTFDFGLFFMSFIATIGYGGGIYALFYVSEYIMYPSTHPNWTPTLLREWTNLTGRFNKINVSASNSVNIVPQARSKLRF